MKSIVFKLKFNHPNKRETPKLNVNHFSYICKRARAMLNDRQSFSCFGKVSEIGIKEFGDINDFEFIKNHIKEKSKNKTTIYKCVVSLKEQDAIQKNYDERKTWEKLMKNNASKFAKQMGIKIEDFEYVCSVHMEKGHPHMHFMAWDKNQEILRTNIPKNNFSNIRKSLTNYIFKDDLENLYTKKNESKKSYKNFVQDLIKELDPIFNMTDDEYKKYLEKLKSLDEDLNETKIFNNNIDEKYISDIFKEIYELKANLPKNGRLNYGFMPEDVKRQIDVISKKILASNIEVRKSFNNYINSVKDITEFSSNDDAYINKNVKSAEDELLNFLGNQILKICKDINNKEFNIKRNEFEKNKEEIEEQEKNFQKQEILGLVSSVINFMTKSENKNKNIALQKENKDNLQFKKELAKKMQNKSQINWENER